MPLIGVDLLGGDHHHFDYILETLCTIYEKTDPPTRLLIFVTPELHLKLKRFQASHPTLLPDRFLTLRQVEEVIHMEDDPLLAVRRKKKASLSIAIHLLKEKKIDALVSTGNTGALVALTQLHLSLFKGIERSALMALLPTRKSFVATLDVGANVDCTPKRLVQVAQIGFAYQKSCNLSRPRIGLLNIGAEEMKGREEIKKSYKHLQKLSSLDESFVFVGNIEGKEIFSGDIDVLVTDGFTGNIFLKTAEGISSFLLETLEKNSPSSPISRSLYEGFKKNLCSAKYPGAILCGVEAIVMKCHGDADPEALTDGVQATAHLIKNQVIIKMKQQLEKQAFGLC